MSLTEQIVHGDMRAAARLMRDVEDRVPAAIDVLRELYLHTGKAHVIGITGSPGSGKSTLVDKLTGVFRNEGKSVGIIAVDPSSPFTGGAILGDRFRMQSHGNDEAVFIRSVANRGFLGGLSSCTQDFVMIMDAMGKDIILIETVGVGQAEVDIVNTAHTSLVVLVPGMGDDIQAIKAGIIEIGDIFVINKCDREGADRTMSELELVLHMANKRTNGWQPLVFKTEAVLGKGIAELAPGIFQHKQAQEGSPVFQEKKKQRTKAILMQILESEIMIYLNRRLEREEQWSTIIDALMERKRDPYSAVDEIMTSVLCRTEEG